VQHGNQDAKERLAALSQPDPNSLSRQQHEVLTETTLVRKRTQAKQRSDASGQRPAARTDGKKIMENVRKGSLLMPTVPEDDHPPPMPSIPSVASMPQQRQPSPQPQQPQPLPPQQQPQQQQPPQQQPPVHQKQHSPTLSPTSQSPPQSAYPPGQRPLPGSQKVFANAPRYTLTDPGPTQGSGGPGTTPPKKTETPEPGKRPTNQQNRLSSQPSSQYGSQQGPPPQPKPSPSLQPMISTLPPPGTGFDQGPHRQKPQTFQDMGIATAKIEEKDCVIM
jgi:hypothetical protein